MTKILFDIFFSVVGLVLMAPFFLIIAVAIRLESSGSIFFRQVRVGKNGKKFKIYKFRTMYDVKVKDDIKITVGNDRRITRVGAFLRRYKIDELPQLIDVILGRMSIVGPRPEVEEYVDLYPDELRPVLLSVKPGITAPASFYFVNESDLLAGACDPKKYYIDKILPIKIRLSCEYVEKQSFWGDLKIIFQTLKILCRSS